MSDDLSLKKAQAQFSETMKELRAQLAPEFEKIRGDFIRRKAIEFIADKEAIRKKLREQRERRTVRVKSKLP